MAKVWGKRAHNREVIMHAARDLFEENGTEHISFRDIADRAEMSRTTIFNHFPTINDILEALLDEELQNLLDYVETSNKTGSELIISLFYRIIDDFCRYPVLSVRLISMMMVTEGQRDECRKLYDVITANVDGSLPQKEKEEVVTMLIGEFLGIQFVSFLKGESFDRETMRKQFSTMRKRIIQ